MDRWDFNMMLPKEEGPRAFIKQAFKAQAAACCAHFTFIDHGNYWTYHFEFDKKGATAFGEAIKELGTAFEEAIDELTIQMGPMTDLSN